MLGEVSIFSVNVVNMLGIGLGIDATDLHRIAAVHEQYG